MNSVTLPGSAPCVTPKLARFLARLDRPALEAVAQAAIDQLDTLDGDPDLEDDDPAGQSDEDGANTGGRVFYLHGVLHDGPGCPIGDTGLGDRDDDTATSAVSLPRRRLDGTLRLRMGGRP